MAKDRTLPTSLARLNPKRNTPIPAIAATGVIVVVTILILPDVATAGAASSLIFLVTFSLAHWVTILVRQRSHSRPPPGWKPEENPLPLDRADAVMRQLLQATASTGVQAEALTTVAPRPMEEIARVARLHRCESVLLGLSQIDDPSRHQGLESLLAVVDADVVVLRAKPNWQWANVRQILVPVAGHGGHEHLQARLIGSLSRTGEREFRFLRVLHPTAPDAEVRRARRDLARLADVEVRQPCEIDVVLADDAATAISQSADQSDLLILGMQRLGRHRKFFGDFIINIAGQTDVPMLVISRRG